MEVPYVPADTLVDARVKTPVFEIVASPESDWNVGTDDAFITSICPPVPVFKVTGPVPDPIKTPFEVKIESPVPPFGTVKVPVTSLVERSIEFPSIVVFILYPWTLTPISEGVRKPVIVPDVKRPSLNVKPETVVDAPAVPSPEKKSNAIRDPAT